MTDKNRRDIMELIIENTGSKLSKENSIFLIESKDTITKVPTINLERIIYFLVNILNFSILIIRVDKYIFDLIIRE